MYFISLSSARWLAASCFMLLAAFEASWGADGNAPAGRVFGQILDHRGVAIPEARVAVWPSGTAPDGKNASTTDSNGKYEIKNLASGKYGFQLTKEYPDGGSYQFDYVNPRLLEVSGDLQYNVKTLPVYEVKGMIEFPKGLDSDIRRSPMKITTFDSFRGIEDFPRIDENQVHQRAETVVKDGKFVLRGRLRGDYSAQLCQGRSGLSAMILGWTARRVYRI